MTLYQDCSSRHDLPKNMAAGGWGGVLFSLYIYIENLKKSSCQKPLDQFQYNLADMFPWWPFTKIVQAVMICQKIWLLGWGLFPLYIYIENFNDHLVRNHWTDLNITLQECVLCNPLSRMFKPSWFVAPSRWGLFSQYIYIENFKNFLVRSHWTDFNITWQNYFLGDPLPRFFK